MKTLVGEEMEKLEELADAGEAPRPKHKPINTRYRSTTDPDSRVLSALSGDIFQFQPKRGLAGQYFIQIAFLSLPEVPQ